MGYSLAEDNLTWESILDGGFREDVIVCILIIIIYNNYNKMSIYKQIHNISQVIYRNHIIRIYNDLIHETITNADNLITLNLV